VAIAAAAAAFVAGVVVAHPRHDSGSSAARLRAAATSALARPGAHVGTLAGTSTGAPTVRAVVDPDGNGYLFADALPALASGRTYQLWTLDSGTPVSLGVIGSRPTVVAFPAGTQPRTLAITDEAAPGAPAPTSTPLVSGAVS
jgi:anti-sigma-K factor RskA